MDHRKAYCRVYDPRNFEFEITFENLLYILENTNSIKGKGLEGEFVYGWDGKDLVLMPVDSPDYKEISEYNRIIHNNEHIKAKDLVVGATYITKDNQEYIYMGRFDYYSYGYRYIENGEVKQCNGKDFYKLPRELRYADSTVSIDYNYGKHHWFAYKYDKNENLVFEQMKSIPKGKLIKCADEKCTSEYADIYEYMIGRPSFSPRDDSKAKYIKYTFEEFERLANETKERYGRITHINESFLVYPNEKSIIYKDIYYYITKNEKEDNWTIESWVDIRQKIIIIDLILQ